MTAVPLNYRIVDVFTESALTGNPLAVVFHEGQLTSEKMQAVAREFNLSETTFVERRPAAVEAEEGVRVRIFTTREELPFAGHPTLGTAAVLRDEHPEVAPGGRVRLALNVGTIPVEFDSAGRGTMTQRDPEFGAELDRTEVARLCGLAAEDLDPVLPPQIVSTGTAFCIVPLASAQSLARLNVDQPAATPWLQERGARWFFVLAPTGEPAPAWRARMQFNGGEDPATGSASGCAIGYLVARRAVASGETIHLRQGVEIGRPSEIFLSARLDNGKVTEVRVGGGTVPVASGRLFLP